MVNRIAATRPFKISVFPIKAESPDRILRALALNIDDAWFKSSRECGATLHMHLLTRSKQAPSYHITHAFQTEIDMAGRNLFDLSNGLDISLPKKIHNVYLTTIIAVMGGSLFGFDISSMSGFVGDEPFTEWFGVIDPSTGSYTMPSLRQAGITASMAGGSFLGSLVSGSTSDLLGRRTCIQLSALIWVIGAAIQCSSQNIVQLIFGRVIAGWSVGFASSQVPVYVSEMAPKHIRGRLVGLFQWAVEWGILIMFFISFGCGYIGHRKSQMSFRTAWGIQMIPGAILFIGMLFLEESPRWLAQKGRWDDCRRVIAQIQSGGNEDTEVVMVEFEEIKEVVIAQQTSKFGFLDLFRGKTNLRRTIVGMCTQMWQQLTGMNIIMYYVVYIFQMAGSGFGGDTSTPEGQRTVTLVSSSIQYILFVVMTLPTLFFVDRWGRRRLMFWGSILIGVFMWCEGAILAAVSVPADPNEFGSTVKIKIPKDQKAASKAAIAMSYLCVCAYAPTWAPAAWIYTSEIFPLEQRATAVGLSTATNWIFNFAIGMFTPSAFEHITYKTYFIFGTFCVVMAIQIFFMFPETKGFTLEEIGQMWDEGVPAWRSSKWKPVVPDIKRIANNTGDSVTVTDEEKFNEKNYVEHVEDADGISPR